MRRSRPGLLRDEESPNCKPLLRLKNRERSQGTVLANSEAAKADGKCNRKKPPNGPAPKGVQMRGKGEMVR